MKILFVIEKFWPNQTPITNNLNPVIKKMLDKKIRIDVITYRQNDDLVNFENIDGVNIYRIDDIYNIIKKASLIKKIFLRVHRKLFLEYLFVKKGREILKKNKYDIVIAFSYPFIMEKYANKITTNTKSVFLSYQFDPYYNNILIKNSNNNNVLKEEIVVLSNATKIFLPPIDYELNMKNNWFPQTIKNKYVEMPFALLREPIESYQNPLIKNTDHLNFVYAGALYDNVRNPFPIIDFFTQINIKYRLHLYYISEEKISEQLLLREKEINGDLLLYRNYPKETCDNALFFSDIIINIGNNILNQTPSKIYEMISYGKPIVNFYTLDGDTSKKMLDKYPLKINIKLPFTEESIKQFEDFCLKNKNERISYEAVTKYYETADQVVDRFIKEIERINENK